MKSKCKCKLCSFQGPVIDKVRLKLTGKLLKDFDELIEGFFYDVEDGDVAKEKLNGDWPGWEWIKQAKIDHKKDVGK